MMNYSCDNDVMVLGSLHDGPHLFTWILTFHCLMSAVTLLITKNKKLSSASFVAEKDLNENRPNVSELCFSII